MNRIAKILGLGLLLVTLAMGAAPVASAATVPSPSAHVALPLDEPWCC